MTRLLRNLPVVLLAMTPLFAHAQHRDDRHEGGRERYHTPHMVYDDRFHHNHYYPSVGYGVAVLPAGNIALSFRGGGRYFFHGGVWYAPGPGGYIVTRPPFGIVVPVLPPAYSTVYVGGAPYYYANDVYYTQAPGGYAVAQPPADTQIAEAPPLAGGVPPPAAGPAPAPQAAAPNWYYCDSSKSFYPYVAQCAGGWRQVPATPPR
jgi:hypothetical protein